MRGTAEVRVGHHPGTRRKCRCLPPALQRPQETWETLVPASQGVITAGATDFQPCALQRRQGVQPTPLKALEQRLRGEHWGFFPLDTTTTPIQGPEPLPPTRPLSQHPDLTWRPAWGRGLAGP